MSKVYRVYVEKRKDYAVEADEILNNLRTQLKLDTLTSLSVVNRYDVQGVSVDVLNQGIPTILSEPMVDDIYKEEYLIKNKLKENMINFKNIIYYTVTIVKDYS